VRTIGIGLAVHRAIEAARVSLGESEDEILARLLLPARGRRRSTGVAPAAPPGSGAPRNRGLWSVEIGGRMLPAANLKRAYRLLLRELDAAYPHFLEAFADEKTFGRRFVARARAALYPRSPHLGARHAEPIGEGWYFDANLSLSQVAKRARVAARLCGLHYGSDVRILDNLREI
jgi:hypothetical protein